MNSRHHVINPLVFAQLFLRWKRLLDLVNRIFGYQVIHPPSNLLVHCSLKRSERNSNFNFTWKLSIHFKLNALNTLKYRFECICNDPQHNFQRFHLSCSRWKRIVSLPRIRVSLVFFENMIIGEHVSEWKDHTSDQVVYQFLIRRITVFFLEAVCDKIGDLKFVRTKSSDFGKLPDPLGSSARSIAKKPPSLRTSSRFDATSLERSNFW